MPNIEIILNDERLCIAGHEKEQWLQISVTQDANLRKPIVTAYAKVRGEGGLETLAWLKDLPPLEVNDALTLRLVPDGQADPGESIAAASKLASTAKEVSCSFCGRSQKEVGTLIAGISVFICDECVAMCSEIIADKK